MCNYTGDKKNVIMYLNRLNSLQRGKEARKCKTCSRGSTPRPIYDGDKSVQYDCLRVQTHSILHAKTQLK